MGSFYVCRYNYYKAMKDKICRTCLIPQEKNLSCEGMVLFILYMYIMKYNKNTVALISRITAQP